MAELKKNVSRNITALRRANGMTQSDLAQRLNYSDKAISKWERGDSLPDVAVLKAVADTFGVSVDYLLAENDGAPAVGSDDAHHLRINRTIITLLSACSVLLIATIAFVVLELAKTPEGLSVWAIYLYSLPVVLIVLIIFNAMWGRRLWNFLLISGLVWSGLLCVYMMFFELNIWLIFVIGIPVQAIIILWANLRPIGGKNDRK